MSNDREERERINAALRHNEAMFGDIRRAKGLPEPRIKEMAPVRQVVNRSDEDELEAAVMKEVTHLLQVHPSVILAIRANSGSAQIRGKDGKNMPIWFNRFIKSGDKYTVTDFWGLANFGMFVIEAKRRNWKYCGTEKEQKQKGMIDLVIRLGGRGGFVTSAQEAQLILEGK
jgi:hypothetical protein